MLNTIGFKECEKMLKFGKTVGPKDALSIGLLDEIVDDSLVLTRAEELMISFCKVPSNYYLKYDLQS
jgi:enoyl-CoA hydratase/carnithine racemase